MGLFSGATYGLQTTSGPATPRAIIKPKAIDGPTTTHVFSIIQRTVESLLKSYSRHFGGESKRENRRIPETMARKWAFGGGDTPEESRNHERTKSRRNGGGGLDQALGRSPGWRGSFRVFALSRFRGSPTSLLQSGIPSAVPQDSLFGWGRGRLGRLGRGPFLGGHLPEEDLRARLHRLGLQDDQMA